MTLAELRVDLRPRALLTYSRTLIKSRAIGIWVSWLYIIPARKIPCRNYRLSLFPQVVFDLPARLRRAHCPLLPGIIETISILSYLVGPPMSSPEYSSFMNHVADLVLESSKRLCQILSVCGRSKYHQGRSRLEKTEGCSRSRNRVRGVMLTVPIRQGAQK
ncbi:hypothetical protein F5Y16DRAFT_111719 [Xylariaceae sp. FL0255]|nr:hypothetical protein F5Y16DRAFT_111719 [Xylariaceae sp. FL0255]